MSATIVPENNLHYPVLLKEVLSIISPQNGGTFIDCTFGQGGYTKKILEFPYTKVIALDRDIKSKNIANKFKTKFKDRFQFFNKNTVHRLRFCKQLCLDSKITSWDLKHRIPHRKPPI